jgi:triacylglycerol lipase
VLAGLSPARRRLVLALLALVAAAVVALAVVLLLPGEDGRSAEPVRQDEVGPVVLVPGYGGSAGSMQALADRLTAAGREVAVVDPPGDGTGDLNATADVLAQTARAAMTRTGAPSVDVVGYSAGGVVARLWIADGGADVVRRVVTLGSPHHGTGLAGLATTVAPDQCPPGCRQLAPDSELLAHLNAGDETPDGPTWVSIWTTQDETVTPPDSARLDGALDIPVQSVCADARVGHAGLPGDPLVGGMVLAELGTGDPVPLGAADCTRLGGS